MKSRLPLACIALLILPVANVWAQETVRADGSDYLAIGESTEPFYSVRLPLAPLPGADRIERVALLFGARQDGSGYRFGAEADGWRLEALDAEGVHLLAEGRETGLPTSDGFEVVLKRREWLVTVALNGRVLAEVADGRFFGGIVAIDPSLCGPAGEPLVQPVSRLFFEDGFMRPEDDLSLGQWKVVGGQWELHSIREDVDDMNIERIPDQRKPQGDHSANPFSVSARAPGATGLLTNGYWFWDDLDLSVALRNEGAPALGLAFNVQGPDDYFLLRWENGSRTLAPTSIRLLRVKDGRREELAAAWVSGQMHQWYKLGVRTCGRRIQAVLDEAVIIDTSHDESLGGQIGLYVEGGDDQHRAFFDDVLAKTLRTYELDDAGWLTDHAAARSGEWDIVARDRPAAPGNHAAVLRSDEGRLEYGTDAWEPPLVEARVTVPAAGQQVGVDVGLGSDSERPYRVTLSGTAAGTELAVSELGAGAGTELAALSDLGLTAGKSVALRADATRPGELNVYLDGEMALHVAREPRPSGRVGLFAHGFPGAEFRDVRVAFERREDAERPPAREVFREDPFMKHWSSPQGAWWPVEGAANTWWHVGDFYRRSEIQVPFDERIVLVHCATAPATEAGYALVQERTQAGDEGARRDAMRLRLLRLGQEVGSAVVEPDGSKEGRPVLVKEGPYLWVSVAGREVITYRDPEPLTGTKVALSGVTSDGLSDVAVRRYGVRDYYFEEAPADWYRTGDWKVTTRFSCDPRWSFMTALGSQSAALFSKYAYSGDVTLEAYMGTRMGTPEMQGRYWRVGDFNLALCGSPLALDSGYSFIVGGWDRCWSDSRTYLMKGDRAVAETWKRLLPNVRREDTQNRVLPCPWISGGRDIHGAWYYIKAAKHGDTLTSYVDNYPAYTYKDAEPIDTYRPAIWTYDTQIVVARLKVSYRKRSVPGRLVDPPAARQEQPAVVAAAPMIISPTHPGFQDDFESGECDWTTYEGQQSSVLSVTAATAASGKRSLMVSNPGTGGLMEALSPIGDAGIRAGRARVLSFDYRIPADVKINLFVRADGQDYYVHMTGIDQANAFYRRLGQLSVTADDEWHHAEFPLAVAFRQAGGGEDARLEGAWFGSLHRGLLQAGFGGNGAGATYYIDNFRILSGGGASFQAACRDADVGPGSAVLGTVDQFPATVPAQSGALERKDLNAGEWVCHAQVKRASGELTAVANLPFIVADDPLDVVAVDPAPGSAWGTGPFEVQFAGGNAPFLKEESLALSVNGRQVEAAPGLFKMDWLNNRLAVDLQATDLQVADGERYNLELRYSDELGRDYTKAAEYVASVAEDHTPPSAVSLARYMPPQDFEHDSSPWETSRDDAALMRDSKTAASGDWSLKVQNLRQGSAFMVFPLKGAFGAGQYPLVEFDYLVPPGVEVDMVTNNPGGYATVGLTDRSHYGHYLFDAAGFLADGQWHHAEVPLLSGLRRVPYRRGVFEQRWMALGDFGYRANALGAYYQVDNFRFVPLVSGARPLELSWTARDLSGIAGYSYSWTAGPDGEPDDAIDSETPTGEFSGLPDHDAWFHIKARDAAGNWGETSHFRFRVDAAAPTLVETMPAPGTRSATSDFVVAVDEPDSAVDPETLVLKVDGLPYYPQSRGIAYDPDKGRLVWNWVKCHPKSQRSIPDGATVAMSVSASDFAGNSLPEQTWSWTMDHSLDHDPPTAPALEAASMPVMSVENFDSGPGQWRNARGNDWGASVRQVFRDEANGDHCLELFATRPNAHFDAVAHQGQYDLTEYPLVSFDYRMPEPVLINMQVRLNNAWFSVKLTAPKCQYRQLGELPALTADDAWHHAIVDLLGMARAVLPNADRYTVNDIRFGDPARNGNRKNARWFVDGFMIGGYGAPAAELKWQSEDITGVAGYSVVFDREMSTVPGHEVSSEAEAGTFEAGEPGVWWLHVSSYDGNGNWSPTRHMAYPVAPPPPSEPAAEEGSPPADEVAPAEAAPAEAAPAGLIPVEPVGGE